jgi:hypothetical protein
LGALVEAANLLLCVRCWRHRPGERVASLVPPVHVLLLALLAGIALALQGSGGGASGPPFGVPVWAWLVGAGALHAALVAMAGWGWSWRERRLGAR